ncbi:ABC transporter permease [Pseudonocardia ailaonensis]|uniref:ABC transporter permease n=1 Tax=Pseudonocardia ailaonensis TaxID=367279 RepID=A0ABN2N3I8_9PSEU
MTSTSEMPAEAAEARLSSPQESRRRAGGDGRGALATALIRLAILAGILVVWQVVGDLTTFGRWVSDPLSVAARVGDWARSGLLWEGTRVTLSTTLLGFALGTVVGGLAGVLLGVTRRLGALLEPFILALYSIPKIALAPLFLLWFGIGQLPKIMLAAMLVGFLIFFNVYQGTKTIDGQLIAIVRLMGAGRVAVIRKVALPYLSAWLFAGLKMGLPYALIGAVVGEFMASTAGLGYMVKNASSMFDTDGVFAGLIVLMTISTVLFLLLTAAEKRVLHWAGRGI